MLPAGEPPIPENGVILSSSSTSSSPILDPPPPQAHHIDRNTNNNLPENRDTIDILETELLCDESFSEIIKEEEAVGTSDASSTNCTVFELNERKRLRCPSTDDDEEADGNATEAISDVSKLRRVHEAEQGRKEHDDGQNGNQESEHGERGEGGNQESELDDYDEEEGGNQENNNGDEDKKENEETSEEEEEKTEELDEGEGEEHEHEEHRENAGSENNVNHQNSEQNESGNQESEGDKGEEDGENDENQEESDNDHEEDDDKEDGDDEEEEEEEDEEKERKAAEKGKRPMSEICKLKSIVPKFSYFEEGGPSDTPEGNQTHNDSTNDDTELTDHQDLAILKSIWHFNCNNGYVPYPNSDVLHNHIMDSISNLQILGEDLTKKITEFQNNFNVVWELDGDNPEMVRPVDREIFDLSMLLWGNSEYNVGAVQQNQQEYYYYYDDDDWSWIRL